MIDTSLNNDTKVDKESQQSASWDDVEIEDENPKYDHKMYVASLTFCGLSPDYPRSFQKHLMTDKDTGAPIIDEKSGKQKTTLRYCNASKACVVDQAAVWTQVNEPYPNFAIWTSKDGKYSYPKKATNRDIQHIRNVTLDAEYPPAPHLAHEVGRKLVAYLASIGLCEANHPIEDSGAGFHIVLPIVPIDTLSQYQSEPEISTCVNGAVARVVKTLIEPEFNRLCLEAGIVMDLEGFDISRILSFPGTYRPTNPDKEDADFLKDGYLRHWLEPYVNGNYPVRKENAKLTQLIRESCIDLQNDLRARVTRGKISRISNIAPNDLTDDVLISKIMASQKNGAEFTRLWYGDVGTDWSSADLALCNFLAFWTGKDASRMDSIFRQSGLMRDKWDRKARADETYGEGTIREAIAGCHGTYDPNYGKSTELLRNQDEGFSRDGTIKAKPVPLKIIERYMAEMQYGDGGLFRACFEGQVVYDHLEKEWYMWCRHHWKRDTNGFIKVLISGHLGDVYIKASGELNIERAELKQSLDNLSGGGDKEIDLTAEPSAEEEELKSKIKRIDNQIKQFQARSKELRKSGYKNAVLDYATTACAAPLNGDDTSVWDSKKGLLGVKNGVLDLRTGDFRDGLPSDYIRTVCPTEWKGLDAPCPLFTQFLQDLFELREDRDELIQFLQRLLGYALTGTCQEALFVILCGALGRNGKTTLFKILTAAIGKALVGDIQKELLLDSGKNAPANGAKPDVLALQGKRFAIAAETKKGDKLNISAIKNYTGGDELSGRPVFGKHFVRFDPTHTLFLHTNYKPHADSGDEAFWARACLIDFEMRFVEEPDPSKPNERKYDPSLVNRIIENELPGVLAWIVRGALEYRKIGLKKPESVKLASQNYRIEEDTLLTFIKECCVVNEKCKAGASALYTAYKEWSGGTYQLNSKEFPKQMKAKFAFIHTKTGSFYQGIGILSDGSSSPDDGHFAKGDETFGDPSPSQLPFLDTETSLSASHAANASDIHTVDLQGDGSDETFLKVPSGNAKNFKSEDFTEKSITSITSVDNNNNETACEAGLGSGDGHQKVSSPEKSSITSEISLLYTDVIKHLRARHSKMGDEELLWRADGYENAMLKPKAYQQKTKSMLESGDAKQQKAAIEAMKRTLGIWED